MKDDDKNIDDEYKDYGDTEVSHGTDEDQYDPRLFFDDGEYETTTNLEGIDKAELNDFLTAIMSKNLHKKRKKRKVLTGDYHTGMRSIKLENNIILRFLSKINEQASKKQSKQEDDTPQANPVDQEIEEYMAAQQQQPTQEVPQEEQPELSPEEYQQAMAAQQGGVEQDPNMAADGMVDPNADPNMADGQPYVGADPNDPNSMYAPPTPAEETGATFAQADLSPEQLGRVYELKRIYNRLLSAEEFLSFSADEVLMKLRKYVADSIDIFELVISNIDMFKDKVDMIIEQYYMFLKYLYHIIKTYYDNEKDEKIDIRDDR